MKIKKEIDDDEKIESNDRSMVMMMIYQGKECLSGNKTIKRGYIERHQNQKKKKKNLRSSMVALIPC